MCQDCCAVTATSCQGTQFVHITLKQLHPPAVCCAHLVLLPLPATARCHCLLPLRAAFFLFWRCLSAAAEAEEDEEERALAAEAAAIEAEAHKAATGGDAEQKRRIARAWTAHKSGEGQVYYHNSITGESSWSVPDGYVGDAGGWVRTVQSHSVKVGLKGQHVGLWVQRAVLSYSQAGLAWFGQARCKGCDEWGRLVGGHCTGCLATPPLFIPKYTLPLPSIPRLGCCCRGGRGAGACCSGAGWRQPLV